MSTPYFIQLDLDRIAAKMSAEEGCPISQEEVVAWLEENGFTREKDGWVAEAADVALLQQSEIIDLRSMFPGAPDFAEKPIEFPHNIYQMDQAKRESLATMADYDKCVIPSFLCGQPRQVRQKCRRIAKKVIRDGNWKSVMSMEPFVHVDDSPGFLMISQDSFLSGEENVLLYYPMVEMFDIIFDMFDRHKAYELYRDLIIEGTENFWFCLCMVGGYKRHRFQRLCEV